MISHSPLLRALVAGFTLVLGLSCAAIDMAQSGRRARTPPPSAPLATPEPTPTPTSSPASSEKPKPRFTFLVGLDRRDAFSNIPLYAYDGALRSLVDRLDDSPVVHVSGTQSDMNRSDAVQKAKVAKEGYVVWLELEVDTMSSQNSRTPDMVIQFLVLAPTTAKPLTSGRTYTQAQRNRGGILNPTTSSIYGDRYLNLAAEEAADRILAYFRSHGPVPSPPIKKP